jgi:hypothetical protein
MNDLKSRLLANTAYPLPTLGAIRMGGVQTNDEGDRLPVKDDSFTITAQTKDRNGQWIVHPLQAVALKAQAERPARLPTATGSAEGANAKLRAIQVRFLVNDTQLLLRETYEAFDKATGRPLCRGDGKTARRVINGEVTEQACPTPELCEFAAKNRCKHLARLSVQVEGQDDALSTFILRTTGFNAARTLRAKLEMVSALTGGRLRGLPFWLVMRSKSTRMSLNTPFFYADLELGCELAEATQRANAQEQADQQSGLDIGQLEQTLRALVGNSAIEDTEEDAGEFEDLLVEHSARGAGTEADRGDERPLRTRGQSEGRGYAHAGARAADRARAVIAALQVPASSAAAPVPATTLPSL